MNLVEKDLQYISDLFRESVRKGAVKESDFEEIYPLACDASTKKYYRIKTISNSYVLCLDKPYHNEESPFLEVQRFLLSLGVRVPHIYDFDLEKGYFLEEDLGDSTLLNYSINFSLNKELRVYKKCIDLMVKFQSSILNNNTYSFQKLHFDQEKLDWEVGFSIQYLFDFLIGSKIQNWEQEIAEVRRMMGDINKVISEKKMVFTHRDFHSRNIMVKNSDLIVIDFQDARLGLPQYDLVSLIDDCYYEMDYVNKENIKKYYFGQLGNIINDQKSYSDFSYFYDLMCIQRTFKALGTFASLFNLRSDKRYLKYIAFAFEKLKKIMWKYHDLHDLRKNLLAIYYEN